MEWCKGSLCSFPWTDPCCVCAGMLEAMAMTEAAGSWLSPLLPHRVPSLLFRMQTQPRSPAYSVH